MKRMPEAKVVTAHAVALAACRELVAAAPTLANREELRRAVILARFAVAMKT